MRGNYHVPKSVNLYAGCDKGGHIECAGHQQEIYDSIHRIEFYQLQK